MELIVCRHAEPMSEAATEDAQADPALTERGRQQAEHLAEWLSREDVDRIVSSPARRARETAAPLAERIGLEVVVDDRLRDAGGDYVSFEHARQQGGAAYQDRLSVYRETDRLPRIADRVCAALEDWASRAPGGRVLAFAHGSTVNVFAARLLGLAQLSFLEASYASAHRFLISSTGIRSVKSLNETGYLPRGLSGPAALAVGLDAPSDPTGH